MTKAEENRFEDFFNDDFYVSLKNSLYNYRMRRKAVEKCVRTRREGPVLEVGSGLSPMLDGDSRITYSDLSFSALQSLGKSRQKGAYVAADALYLPFKKGIFQTVVCSEVLEHIPDDEAALHEIARVMADTGTLVLTFPHRRIYFGIDDRFVHHFRRYEIADMAAKLADAGLHVQEIKKVLGPLEKLTMMAVVCIAACFTRTDEEKTNLENKSGDNVLLRKVIAPVFRVLNSLYILPAWLDARVFPRSLASVILIRATKAMIGKKVAKILPI